LLQRDIVLRWISQLSALIARLLRRDPTLSLELARQYLEDAEAQILGPLADLVLQLDPASAARLLGDPNRLYSYAQTVALRSAIERADADPAAADRLARRAIALAREAVLLAAPAPEEWEEWIAEAEQSLIGSRE